MPPSALPPELAAIHRELGIDASYPEVRGLAFQPEAVISELIDIGPNPDGLPVRLLPATARAWEEMRRAALSAQIELLPVSGFRSVARQTEIIRAKLASGRPIADILRVIAAPGYSEHHTGRAIDIGTPGHVDLEEDFGETPAFAWLSTHASRFGFSLSYPRGNQFGISYEPWHWLYAG